MFLAKTGIGNTKFMMLNYKEVFKIMKEMYNS